VRVGQPAAGPGARGVQDAMMGDPVRPRSAHHLPGLEQTPELPAIHEGRALVSHPCALPDTPASAGA